MLSLFKGHQPVRVAQFCCNCCWCTQDFSLRPSPPLQVAAPRVAALQIASSQPIRPQALSPSPFVPSPFETLHIRYSCRCQKIYMQIRSEYIYVCMYLLILRDFRQQLLWSKEKNLRTEFPSPNNKRSQMQNFRICDYETATYALIIGQYSHKRQFYGCKCMQTFHFQKRGFFAYADFFAAISADYKWPKKPHIFRICDFFRRIMRTFRIFVET